MITATGIRRPEPCLELGTRVRFHHAACEMRLPVPRKVGAFGHPELARDEPSSWVECGIGVKGNMPFQSPFGFHLDPHDKRQPFQAAKGINKTLAIWPKEGAGIVISLVRKGIGESYAGYESGYETPEWEPGGFVAKEWVWLYVVKHSMTGMNDLTLVPMDAISAI